MLSLLIVVNKVISDTPTCFFLNPSFQSAYIQINDCIHTQDKYPPWQPWPAHLLSSQQESPSSLLSSMEPASILRMLKEADL
jgi:hypothetical protein